MAERFGFEPSVNSTIIGAIIGGWISGGVALIATLVGIRNAAKVRSIEKQKADRGNAITIVIKVNNIYEFTKRSFRHYFDSSEGNNNRIRKNGQWELVPKPLRFGRELEGMTLEEKSFLVSEGLTASYNDIADADSIAHTYNSLTKEYCKIYDVYTNKLAEIGVLDDQSKNKFELPAGTLGFEINQLIEIRNHLKSFLLGCQEDAKRIQKSVLLAANEKFDTGINYVEMDHPPQAENYYS